MWVCGAPVERWVRESCATMTPPDPHFLPCDFTECTPAGAAQPTDVTHHTVGSTTTHTVISQQPSVEPLNSLNPASNLKINAYKLDLANSRHQLLTISKTTRFCNMRPTYFGTMGLWPNLWWVFLPTARKSLRCVGLPPCGCSVMERLRTLESEAQQM